jgi:hypothetical protein
MQLLSWVQLFWWAKKLSRACPRRCADAPVPPFPRPGQRRQRDRGSRAAPRRRRRRAVSPPAPGVRRCSLADPARDCRRGAHRGSRAAVSRACGPVRTWRTDAAQSPPGADRRLERRAGAWPWMSLGAWRDGRSDTRPVGGGCRCDLVGARGRSGASAGQSKRACPGSDAPEEYRKSERPDARRRPGGGSPAGVPLTRFAYRLAALSHKGEGWVWLQGVRAAEGGQCEPGGVKSGNNYRKSASADCMVARGVTMEVRRGL